MIDLGGEHLGRAGFRRRDRDKTGAGAEVEHAAAGDLLGVVEQITGERLTTGPSESPKGRRHRAARQALLGGLPDRRDLGGEVEANLRYQRRHRDPGIATDADSGVQDRLGEVAGDDPAEHQPADNPIRTELGEAIGRIVGFYSSSLPSELCCRGGKADPEHGAEPCHMTRRPP